MLPVQQAVLFVDDNHDLRTQFIRVVKQVLSNWDIQAAGSGKWPCCWRPKHPLTLSSWTNIWRLPWNRVVSRVSQRFGKSARPTVAPSCVDCRPTARLRMNASMREPIQSGSNRSRLTKEIVKMELAHVLHVKNPPH